ncbi:MAG TPA: hypothetical protein VF266_15575 [Thermoanaerobaculia bacterium]
MFLLAENGVCDSDLGSLVELLEVIDHHIARIDDEVTRSSDPDGLGLCDRMEAVVGLGFVACQQYINATYPQLVPNKAQAIRHPPTLPGGQSAIELINAAANFWKHRDEWPRPNGKDEERTRAVIDEVTSSAADYVMVNVLYELVRPHPLRFAPVVDLLTRWRDLLIAAPTSGHAQSATSAT